MSDERDLSRGIAQELSSYRSGQGQVSAALNQERKSFRNEFDDVSAEQSCIGGPDVGALYGSADDDEVRSAPLWLLTFTDIMALMLTFFVLLYSMSVPDTEQWEEVVKSVEQGMSEHKTLKHFSGDFQELSVEKIDTQRALDLNYLQNLLQQQIKQEDSLSAALLFQGQDRLVVSLPVDLVFEKGKAEVGVEAKRALLALSDIFYRIRNRIEIVGHTDPSPTRGGTYPDNWSLSLARAANVAAVLQQAGYTREVLVRGASSARFDTLSADIPPTLREQMARRVDIVIMKDSGAFRSIAPIR